MTGQFPGGKYLDDLDPEQLTDEQKKALADLLENDPYAFYNLFRDPDKVQRQIEGDDFQTTPAGKLYQQIGALIMAGAPDDVKSYWQHKLETRNRPSEDDLQLPAKTQPIQDKLQQIEDFCQNLNTELNRTDDYTYHPENDFVPEDHPLSGKWQEIRMAAAGEPLIVNHADGFARHYKATDPVLASMGVEIVEITITAPEVQIDLDAYKVTDDVFDEMVPDHVNPFAMDVSREGDTIKLILKYCDIYE